MERKINWNSGCFDEIGLVYEKAENNKTIGDLLSELEEIALRETENSCGLISIDNKPVSRDMVKAMSEIEREKLISILSDFGLLEFNPLLTEPKIVVKFSDKIQKVVGCTMFSVLNRLEKIDGSYNAMLFPKATLELQIPLGGKKGMLKWELLIMQLYPWLSVSEVSSNIIAEELIEKDKTKDDKIKTLSDRSYIRYISINNTAYVPLSGWKAFDVVLDTRPYGWEYIVDSADYLANSDITPTDLTVYDLSGSKVELYDQLTKARCAVKAIRQLESEYSSLALMGHSKVLELPVRILWFNQTNRMRVYGATEDISLVTRYVETVIRRTFNTPDAMALATPASATVPEADPVKKSSTESESDSLSLFADNRADVQTEEFAPVPESGASTTHADKPEIAPVDKSATARGDVPPIMIADKPVTVKRKSIMGTLMLLGGIAVLVAVILLIAFKVSAKIHSAVISSLVALGAILVILAVARLRIEKGKIREGNLFKALTPAQKCLIVFFVSFAAMFFFPYNEKGEPSTVSTILFLICWGTFNASIILAIVRAVRNKSKRKGEEQVTSQTAPRQGNPDNKEAYLQANKSENNRVVPPVLAETGATAQKEQVFKCWACKRELPAKYRHNGFLCADCANAGITLEDIIAANRQTAEEATSNLKKPQVLSGQFEEGVNYLVQSIPEKDLYLVEIHDITRKYLSDSMWAVGIAGYAAFALTEDEYKIMAVNRDTAAMNELVGKLLQHIPKDRLIGSGYFRIGSNEPAGELHLNSKCETMDDGAYQKYKKRAAIQYVKSLDNVYATFMKVTGEKIPSVDMQGYAWVFSKMEYAENTMKANPGVDMYCKKMDREEFELFIKSWYRLGITRFKLNPGINDHYAELERDDYLPIEGFEKWDYAGSFLNQAIIRYKQCRAVKSNQSAGVSATLMWQFICNELYNTPLIVPVSYDGEPDDVADWIIHTTRGGTELMTHIALKKKVRESEDSGARFVAEDDSGKPMYLLNKEFLFGSERYRFAKEAAVSEGRTMHLRTITANGNTYLCGFTDFDSMRALLGSNFRVAVMSYEEIIAFISSRTNTTGIIHGIIINPGTNELILSRENVEKITASRQNKQKQNS